MRKMALALAGALVLLGASLFTLEVLDRGGYCPSSALLAPPLACAQVKAYPDVTRSSLWATVLERRRHGKLPSREETFHLVILVPRQQIAGYNGLACNGHAFVSDDLPPAAREFVARHELEHLFQHDLHLHPHNLEWAANRAAFRAQPWGGIQTTFLSATYRLRHKPDDLSWPCAFVSLWRVFKQYFLP